MCKAIRRQGKRLVVTYRQRGCGLCDSQVKSAASPLHWESRTCCHCFSQLGSGLSPSPLDKSSNVCSSTGESKHGTLAASCHHLFSLVFICFFSQFDVGAAAGKESERTKLRSTDTAGAPSLLRWVVALSCLAMTVAVGLFAM